MTYFVDSSPALPFRHAPRLSILCSLLLLILAAPVRAQVAGQLMTLSANGKYLWNSITGKAVFLVGDTPWDLAVQVNSTDAATYLADRSSRGFNALWMVFADNVYQSNAPYNYYGNKPFDGADFTSEDSSYWSYIDSLVSLAASYGITIFADPAFVGTANVDGYRGSFLGSTDAVVNAYGAWLGNRYKNASNIVWALAGDADPTDTALYEKLNQLATGIQSADPYHLITFEASRFYESGSAAPNSGWSSMDAWGGVSGSYTAAGTPPSWLNLNWVYDPYSAVQANCARNYTSYFAVSPYMPGLMGEDWYEGEHSMTALEEREEAWWEVLSGCTLGRVFGNNPIWCFDSTASAAGCNTGTTWQSQLGSGGSVNQQNLGKLFRTREFWLMAPDTSSAVLTGGIGSGTSISVGSCTSDGQTCIVYDPIGNSQAPQIAMSHFSGTVQAWWFNPQTAAATNLGTFSNSGTQTFTPSDGNDWVLVLDLASANLKAPGLEAPQTLGGVAH